MKALFSEDFYYKFWDMFLEPVPGDDFINLVGEIQKTENWLRESGIPELAWPVVIKQEAQKLADRCKAMVMREMKTIRDIDAGVASFGYTTHRQEIEARGEFRKRFEFNCLQLRDFKAKYELN